MSDMCLSNNVCNSKSSTGNLYFSCIDDGDLVETKNGIRCCSKFNSLLLIPIIFIYLIFGLVLSIIKYSMISEGSSVGPIIIFLQNISNIYFSYGGLYLLPLFRISIDFIDGYCLWKGLDYNFKFFLSIPIIISLFLIGESDIIKWLIIY